MGHSLICGMTESGKTTLAHQIANYYANLKNDERREIIVYDPMMTPTTAGSWPESAVLFTKKIEFLNYIKKIGGRYVIFIDESDNIFSHEQRENNWILTKGRHFGFEVFLITQRPKMIAPSVRAQCSTAYVFRLGRNDLRMVGDDFAHEIADISLDQGDYLILFSATSGMSRGNSLKGKPWKPTSNRHS